MIHSTKTPVSFDNFLREIPTCSINSVSMFLSILAHRQIANAAVNAAVNADVNGNGSADLPPTGSITQARQLDEAETQATAMLQQRKI